MSTTIWHRGKAQVFGDDDAAEDWLKEIEMARAEKRKPKDLGKAKPIRESVLAPSGDYSLVTLTPPDSCDDSCGVAVEENNKGGFNVTHRSRGGNLISGSFRPGESPTAWLERVHGEETA